MLLRLPALSQEPNPGTVGSVPLRKVREENAKKTSRPQRILNGHDTTIEKNPWQVAILDSDTLKKTNSYAASQFCGGSLIAQSWVLTAAHCVDNGTKYTDLIILSGTADLLTGGTPVGVMDGGIVVHSDWNPQTHENDIALLHLSGNAIGTPIVGWPDDDTDIHEQNVTITGWGATTWVKPPTKTSSLQEASGLPVVVPQKQCNQPVSYGAGRVKEKMLCIGDYDHGRSDSCQGDSGGPATSTSTSGIRLIGITSWGPPDDHCGTPQMPGIYTRVSKYLDWVGTHTNGEVSWLH
jgi:secreted trypsin-like serine protease